MTDDGSRPSKIKFQTLTSTVTEYIHRGSVDHPCEKRQPIQEHKLSGCGRERDRKRKGKQRDYHRKEYAYEKGYGVLRFH